MPKHCVLFVPYRKTFIESIGKKGTAYHKVALLAEKTNGFYDAVSLTQFN